MRGASHHDRHTRPNRCCRRALCLSPMIFTYLGARALTKDRLRPMTPQMREASGIDADEPALAYAHLHAAAAKRDAAATPHRR